jgi:hypothetical protein
MRRLERVHRGGQTASAAVISRAKKDPRLGAAPRLKLLLEREPAHRVFFRNLADLASRSTLPAANISRPGLFWRDVFVSAHVPWRRMLESVLYHTIAVAAMLILSQLPVERTQPQPQSKSQKWYVVYYTSSQPFPSRADRLRTSGRSTKGPKIPQQALRVAQEHRRSSIRAPEIKLVAYRPPAITVSSPILPTVPFSGIRRLQLLVPAAQTSVVGPPQDSRGIVTRWPALPQTSVILPAASVGQGVSRGRAMNSPDLAVVAPPALIEGVSRKLGGIDIGSAEIVGPSPQASNENPAIWAIARMTTGIAGPSVVPPAPSLQGSESIGPARSSSTYGFGLQGASLAATDSGATKSDTSGPLVAMNTRAGIIPPRPISEKLREPATQELPVRLLGLALALPNSAYFSNTEVYIAERSIAKGETELIKLVYISLPYQPRLSEFGLNNSTIYKLRVSRDQSCDETLLQMTWPENEAAGRQSSAKNPVLSPSGRDSVLPCYRTTADDYRKALSRKR